MLYNTTLWYTSWFDSPYYHILYQDRDHKEAAVFMDNLTRYLCLNSENTILDLACGRGRHSLYLNSLGYPVTGVDLSEQSIAFASQYENDTLQFKVHNMCYPIGEKYDAVFNLFTSFGYFDDESDNLNTIKAIKSNLKKTGYGVIDFMNVVYVTKNLVPQEIKVIDHIPFHIKRYIKDGFIFKDITFSIKGRKHFFTERVKLLTLSDFESYFTQAGVRLKATFGNYKLEKFDPHNSERLILIFN